MSSQTVKPATLRQLRESGWQSKTVKRKIHDNFLAALSRGDELFPGIVGYDSTVIPEINLALLAGHELNEHASPGEATLQVLRGRVRVTSDEDSWEGGVGEHVVIPADRHGVAALEDSAVLLTVVKPLL